MPAAVILAGGRGERLGGVIKSELRVGGARLLERVARRLAGCEPVLVAHGRIDPELLRLPEGFVPVPDLAGEYAGPLAGFAAAVDWLARATERPELLITVAVDTPFLPADYVGRLVEGLGRGNAAIASYAGQIYPTNGIWRLSAFGRLAARLADGSAPHSLKRLAGSSGGGEIAWPESAAGDPFANANTPEDLAALERRAAVEKPGSG